MGGTSNGGGSATGKVVGFVALVVFILLLSQLFSADPVAVFGLDVPAWVLGFALYLLGAVAMWGATRDQQR